MPLPNACQIRKKKVRIILVHHFTFQQYTPHTLQLSTQLDLKLRVIRDSEEKQAYRQGCIRVYMQIFLYIFVPFIVM